MNKEKVKDVYKSWAEKSAQCQVLGDLSDLRNKLKDLKSKY